ncbi:MAG: hypothetical protein R3B06_32770 [Kofleriaceae bacterium]
MGIIFGIRQFDRRVIRIFSMDVHWVKYYLSKGTPLAAPTIARAASELAWLGIYPLWAASEGGSILGGRSVEESSSQLDKFRVRVFGVAKDAIDAGGWLSEEDLVDYADVIVSGFDALFEELARFSVSPEDLEQHWKVDYPI